MADLIANTVASRPNPGPPTIPDHELLHRIGRGSYGEVWLARNHTRTLRAVKIIRRAGFSDDRPYEREFTGLKNFEPLSREHEGLVDILHLGRSDAEGWFYSIMELADDAAQRRGADSGSNTADGGQARESTLAPADYRPLTLEHRIRTEGRLPVKECVRIAATLADALRFLHERGLVHRDIKPSNIIFVGGVPKLADVGLVARSNSASTFVGTEGFIPPEGPGTPRADLYSLGKCLYEMAMGKDRQAFPSPPTLLDELPDRDALLELNEVITKVCDPNPARRYRTAAMLQAELARLDGGNPARAARLRWRRVRAAAWLAVSVLFVSGLWLLWQARSPLVLREEFIPPRGTTVFPEGIQDYAGDGIVRLLTIGPDNEMQLVSTDGQVVERGGLSRAAGQVGPIFVASASANQPKDIYLSWHEGDRAVLGRFNTRLQEITGARREVPLSYHTNRAGVRQAETWLTARALRASGSLAPAQLLVTYMTGHPLWPRELRCYDPNDGTLLWRLPWAANASEAPPVFMSRPGQGAIWLIGSVSNDNGAALPDGDSDQVSCLRAISDEGAERWRLPTGDLYSACEPLVAGADGRQSIFALVRRWADIYWLSTNTIPALGRVLRVSPDGHEEAHYDAAAGVEFSSLRTLATGVADRFNLLVTDSQGALHVLDENLNPVRTLRAAPPPPDTNSYIQMELAEPADLDGDGRLEVSLLYSTVEFLSGRDLRHDSESNNRLYHRTTLVVYDADLHCRASRRIEEQNSVVRWHLRVLPVNREGQRELAVVGPTVQFFRFKP